MNETITALYGNQTRIRVCGLCWQEERLLMVNHHLMGKRNFWAPPGGGVEFGQRAGEALIREFREETGLHVQVGDFRFITELVSPPLHAVELFFQVQVVGGFLQTGTDPEMPAGNQVIQAVEFMDWAKLLALPQAEKHGILRYCNTLKDLQTLTGFYRI
jgi:8-oxo-dGTP diphosphatase